MMGWVKKAIVTVLLAGGILLVPQEVRAQDYVQDLMDELNLSEVDEAVEQDAIPDKLRFYDLAKAFAEDGTDGVDAQMVCEYVFDLFFYEIAQVKPIFYQIIVIALVFALFGKLLVVRQGYASL